MDQLEQWNRSIGQVKKRCNELAVMVDFSSINGN
jgi:hypothetical protein